MNELLELIKDLLAKSYEAGRQDQFPSGKAYADAILTELEKQHPDLLKVLASFL